MLTNTRGRRFEDPYCLYIKGDDNNIRNVGNTAYIYTVSLGSTLALNGHEILISSILLHVLDFPTVGTSSWRTDTQRKKKC
jgi:hypothetical protein